MKKKTATRKMEITEININKISANSLQPRKEFDKDKIKELAQSIKEVGLINPIQVKKISDSDDKNNKYEIVCGERRFRACKLLKLKKINTIIKTYNDKDKKNEMIESLVENLHRSNLTSVENENYITRLFEVGKFKSVRALAEKIGYGESTIQHILSAKKIRDNLNISNDITTRTINDMNDLEKEDMKSILKKIKNKELGKSRVREYSRILKKSSKDIKQALLKNQIDIKQAEQISKIENPKIKKEVLKAHKEIKNIDKGIEQNLLKKVKFKDKTDLIKVNELNNLFRANIVELQNQSQTTIKNFLKCINHINLMDDEQISRLKYNSELFEANIQNMLMILEKGNEVVKSC